MFKSLQLIVVSVLLALPNMISAGGFSPDSLGSSLKAWFDNSDPDYYELNGSDLKYQWSKHTGNEHTYDPDNVEDLGDATSEGNGIFSVSVTQTFNLRWQDSITTFDDKLIIINYTISEVTTGTINVRTLTDSQGGQGNGTYTRIMVCSAGDFFDARWNNCDGTLTVHSIKYYDVFRYALNASEQPLIENGIVKPNAVGNIMTVVGVTDSATYQAFLKMQRHVDNSFHIVFFGYQDALNLSWIGANDNNKPQHRIRYNSSHMSAISASIPTIDTDFVARYFVEDNKTKLDHPKDTINESTAQAGNKLLVGAGTSLSSYSNGQGNNYSGGDKEIIIVDNPTAADISNLYDYLTA
jgi:hypothetical protein